MAVPHLRSIIALVRTHGSPLTNTEGGALGSARRAGLEPAAAASPGGCPESLEDAYLGGAGQVSDSTSQQGWKRRECFYLHPRTLWLQCHKPLPELPTSKQLFFSGIIVFQTPWDLSPSLGWMVTCPNVSSTAACVAWGFGRDTGLWGLWPACGWLLSCMSSLMRGRGSGGGCMVIPSEGQVLPSLPSLGVPLPTCSGYCLVPFPKAHAHWCVWVTEPKLFQALKF